MYFTCSCCGCEFSSTRIEQAKFDQDKGYGMCFSCEIFQAVENERAWKKIINFFISKLNKKNKTKFLSYDAKLQRAIILEAFEDGVIKWI